MPKTVPTRRAAARPAERRRASRPTAAEKLSRRDFLAQLGVDQAEADRLAGLAEADENREALIARIVAWQRRLPLGRMISTTQSTKEK